jgi:hypothetical protein
MRGPAEVKADSAAPNDIVPGKGCVVIPVGIAQRIVKPNRCISFADQPFRPVRGVFAPMEKAHTYRGELVFVDHANRRGSIRVEGSGMFFRNSPHPFAMLPCGMIRRHGAPSDLRDIPLGTVMHVKAFLPPDP